MKNVFAILFLFSSYFLGAMELPVKKKTSGVINNTMKLRSGREIELRTPPKAKKLRNNNIYFPLKNKKTVKPVNLQNTPTSPLAKTPIKKFFYENRADEVIKEVKEAEVGHNIFVELPFVSDTKLINSLKEAAERGVEVTVHTKNKTANQLKKLIEKGGKVEAFTNIHSKAVCVERTNDSVLFIGSDNLSKFSRPRDAELLTKVESGPVVGEFIEHFNEMHAKKIKTKKKKISLDPDGLKEVILPGKTPSKTKILNNKVYDITKTICNRLLKFKKSPSADNTLYLTSMGFNDEKLVDSILNMYSGPNKENYPETNLLLDASAIKSKKNKVLIENLLKTGAEKMNIFIYNPDGTKKIFDKLYPEIHHTKVFVRTIKGEKCPLTMISTGNLTVQSAKQEFNRSIWFHDKELCHWKKFKEFFNSVTKNCKKATITKIGLELLKIA